MPVIPLLDSQEIARILDRLASQVLERHAQCDQVMLVGIERRGADLARRLAALLVEESRLAESASLRLTHDQLARHLGSAREVVSRLLKDFQNDGLVRLGRGGVELLDLPALEALASDSLR